MGDIIKATVDGKEQEFEILGRDNYKDQATHVIGGNGIVRPSGAGTFLAYLKLVRKTHEFGGATFEETDNRPPKSHEWFLNAMGIPYFNYGADLVLVYRIIRPVSVSNGLA